MGIVYHLVQIIICTLVHTDTKTNIPTPEFSTHHLCELARAMCVMVYLYSSLPRHEMSMTLYLNVVVVVVVIY